MRIHHRDTEEDTEGTEITEERVYRKGAKYTEIGRKGKNRRSGPSASSSVALCLCGEIHF